MAQCKHFWCTNQVTTRGGQQMDFCEEHLCEWDSINKGLLPPNTPKCTVEGCENFSIGEVEPYGWTHTPK
ncbi:hypothetical protein COV24_03030 [candidate division WWE3 bacterium CG10_big_fil_rev_8_21_14_0_10_32_10]|uniref:Uncharacterized protein n=1 Tax=candidate division WWE3 bacterium CG10_big_fil_rev_8_21_14_0_10_32_10 TaxID=1975090 RepID=A0A2H0RA49_UNCKA|nr:MAG: hypothetical protein COV24_03030 [candidate division WWE3 bacterium CG10_big_fil_rev_8_21_14_0_10_32_10]